MRAYRFDNFKSLDDLRSHEEDMPKPQRGEILVRVRAVSLNYRDLAMLLGRYVSDSKPGLIPTSDATGEVFAVGEGVDACQVGDRVMGAFHSRWFGGQMPKTIDTDGYGSQKDGWLVEYKVVSQEAVIALPDGLSFEEGSTVPCAGLTAWTALSGPMATQASFRFIKVGDRQGLEDVTRAITMSGLKPVIDRVFKFEEARAAFEHLQAAQFVSKIVIRVSDVEKAIGYTVPGADNR
jgi:NADPH:quinone reductase-like Zn-dependent oxidoreductase